MRVLDDAVGNRHVGQLSPVPHGAVANDRSACAGDPPRAVLVRNATTPRYDAPSPLVVRTGPPPTCVRGPNQRCISWPAPYSVGSADRAAQLQDACAAEDEGEQDSADRGDKQHE